MLFEINLHHLLIYESWDGAVGIAAVGIATGYGLDDRGVGVRVPVGYNNGF
jgi:hypothetical protein